MEYIKGENRYYALVNDIEAGEVTYTTEEDGVLVIDHTGVKDDYRGQGIAQKLVKLVVDQALEENKKVIPLCPFAAHEFVRNPEYQKVQKK